ncbi:MAG: hypothetical protein NVS3B1_05520 [Marmoricola sp.]
MEPSARNGVAIAVSRRPKGATGWLMGSGYRSGQTTAAMNSTVRAAPEAVFAIPARETEGARSVSNLGKHVTPLGGSAMKIIDQHLIRHARLDAVSAMLAYIGALFLLVFAISSHSVAAMATLTPLAAMVMLGTSALVLELVRVSPQVSR